MPAESELGTPSLPTQQFGGEERTTPPDQGDDLDLYPQSEDEYNALKTWCMQAFHAAEQARRPFEERWDRYYKLYRSWKQRREGDWRSNVFYPISFWTIEAVTPKLVASLPKFLVLPSGPEDVVPAQGMETLLEWSATNSDLYVELVKATKSALKYGTGILKTFQRRDIRRYRQLVPVTRPVAMPGTPLMDPLSGMPVMPMDGGPLAESMEVVREQVVGYRTELVPYIAYDGPAAEWIDIKNFYPAPEAPDLDSARYLIHRSFKDMDYVLRLRTEGIYRFPPFDEEFDEDSIAATDEEPISERLNSIEMGGQPMDPTRKAVEVLEFWTKDGRAITLLNRKTIVRVAANPFDHGEYPFVPIYDHLVEGEIWGIGELESLEGMQDLINALTNQRVDNVRMVLDAMFAVQEDAIKDPRELRPRPGGIIRIQGQVRPQDALQRLDMGDVTPRAFEEVASTLDIVERTTGVNSYTQGQDSPSLNDTATGVSLLQEAGNTRFALKTRLMELMGLKRLGRQFGALIQQFMDAPKVVRILGPQGLWTFQTFDPASLQGAFDYDIETSSATQTEGVRKQQSLSLLNVVGGMYPLAIVPLLEDVLKAFGIKDINRYLFPGQELGGMGMGMGMPMPIVPGTPPMGPPGGIPQPGQASGQPMPPGPPMPPVPSMGQPGGAV